jgi:hypothetical protein
MKATDCIRMMIEQSRGMLLKLLADLQDLPPTTKMPDTVHHPLWILGHSLVSESGLVARFVVGEEPPLSKWQSMFGRGSKSLADGTQYPSWTELLAEYDKVRARTLEVLAGLSDADLEKPSKAPPEFAQIFGSIGQCMAMLSLHASFHAGQVADVRRALGRPAVMR